MRKPRYSLKKHPFRIFLVGASVIALCIGIFFAGRHPTPENYTITCFVGRKNIEYEMIRVVKQGDVYSCIAIVKRAQTDDITGEALADRYIMGDVAQIEFARDIEPIVFSFRFQTLNGVYNNSEWADGTTMRVILTVDGKQKSDAIFINKFPYPANKLLSKIDLNILKKLRQDSSLQNEAQITREETLLHFDRDSIQGPENEGRHLFDKSP